MHTQNYYLFHIFSKLPLFLKHYISKLHFKPKFKKGNTIYGFTIFSPSMEIEEFSYLHSPIRLDNITIGNFVLSLKILRPPAIITNTKTFLTTNSTMNPINPLLLNITKIQNIAKNTFI